MLILWTFHEHLLVWSQIESPLLLSLWIQLGVRQWVRHLPSSLQFPPLETRKTHEVDLLLHLRSNSWSSGAALVWRQVLTKASCFWTRKSEASCIVPWRKRHYKSQISKAGLNSPTKLIPLMRKTGDAKSSTVVSRLLCGSSELRILQPAKYLDWGQTPPPPRSALGTGSDVEHFNHSLFIK